MSRYDGPSHRVYMFFQFRQGWQVEFLEADLKTSLSRKLTFSDPEKIRELTRGAKPGHPGEQTGMRLKSAGSAFGAGTMFTFMATAYWRGRIPFPRPPSSCPKTVCFWHASPGRLLVHNLSGLSRYPDWSLSVVKVRGHVHRR
jgi:hypothetical protein